MSMFTEKEEKSFLLQFQHDFKKLYSLEGKNQLEQTLFLTRKFFKTIIGRSHEYTTEEALFILKEEEIISTRHYEKLKELLLMLSYFCYSEEKPNITPMFLTDLEELLIEIIRELLEKEKSENFISQYEAIAQNTEKSVEEEDATFIEHKQDIMLTEKKIVHQIRKANQQANELYEENDDMFDESNGFSSSTEKKSGVVELKTSFYDFFCQTIGHEPEYISELLKEDHVAKEIIWDLYTKYHLLGDTDPKKRLSQYSSSEYDLAQIEKSLLENKTYANISSYTYLSEMKAVLLLIVILLLNKKDLREELPKLYNSFSKDTILFVLQKIFPKPKTEKSTALYTPDAQKWN